MAEMTEIKNMICMITAVCLAAGFVACGSSDNDSDSKNPGTTEIVSSETSAEATVTTIPSATASVSIKEGIPELKCSQIRFSDGSIVFADSQGGYSLVNSDYERINSITITDDDGRNVTVICSGNSIIFQISGQNIDYFVYQGHTVELKDGKLYYDKSPVEYEDTSFSEYALSDKYTIICTGDGKYVVNTSDGKTANEFKIKDDSGVELIIYADSNGFMAVNPDDLMEPAFKLNGDLIVTSDSRIYINGKQLVPPGTDDIKIKTSTSTTTTTTAKKTTTTTTKTTAAATTKKTTQQVQQTEPEKETDTEPVSQPEPEPQPDEPSNQNISELTKEMLVYVNEIRSQYGLSELYGLEALDAVAQIRAEELVDSYSHTRPDGRSFDTAIDDAGLEWWSNAENIAYGSNTMSTVKEAFDAWINSAAHRENILNPKLKYMSVAMVRVDNGDNFEIYWEQIFFNDEYVS